MGTINLLEAPMGAKVRIQRVDGDHALVFKLRQYGLFIGDQVCLLRQAPFNGPVLLEINGREIALSHDIAAKVFVEEI